MHSPVGIYRTTPGGRVLLANPALVRMLGFASFEELAACNLEEYVVETGYDRNGVMNRLEQDGEVRGLEFAWKRHDGVVIHIRENARVVRDMDGKTLYYEGTLEDITERKRHTEEREALLAQLYQAEKMTAVGQLAAGVAHEINNPVAFVLPNLAELQREYALMEELLGMVRRGEDSATINAFWQDHGVDEMIGEFSQMLEECRVGAKRIGDITGELRHFARVHGDGVEIVQLTDLVDSVLKLTANEIRYRAKIIKNFSKVPAIAAYGSKISQVFLNILLNAVQSIKDGDSESNWIKVTIGRQDDRIFVEIGNSGDPIPPEIQQRIFEPFFTTKPQGQGSGLGLAISYTIVQQHGGDIEVSSDRENGTVFRVWLPLDTGLEAPEPPSGSPPKFRTGRILVVDDEVILGKTMRRVLSEHTVVVAGSGQEALEILSDDQNFHLVLCDLVMPGVTGMQVFKQVSESHPELAKRFLFMTGGAFTPAARAFVESTSLEVIQKPIDIDALLTLILNRLSQLAGNQ